MKDKKTLEMESRLMYEENYKTKIDASIKYIRSHQSKIKATTKASKMALIFA